MPSGVAGNWRRLVHDQVGLPGMYQQISVAPQRQSWWSHERCPESRKVPAWRELETGDGHQTFTWHRGASAAGPSRRMLKTDAFAIEAYLNYRAAQRLSLKLLRRIRAHLHCGLGPWLDARDVFRSSSSCGRLPLPAKPRILQRSPKSRYPCLLM